MAVIERHGKSWRYRVQGGVDPRTGKYRQITKSGFATKREATLAAHEAERNIAHGSYVAPSRVTFRAFAADWLALYAPNVKVSTVRVRQHELSLLAEFFGETPLQKIKPHEYERALASLAQAGFATNTISGVHTTARMLFKKAREFQLIEKDPTEFARPPRRQSRSITIESTVPKYLERDELARFLALASERGLWFDRPLFYVLAYTGIRIGEALALFWKDFDAKAATLTVSKTLYNPKNNAAGYELLPPKTANGYRVIDIPPSLVAVLLEWQETQRQAKAATPDWHAKHDFIFTAVNRHGFPATQRLVQLHLDRLEKLLDPPLRTRITPHVFRHTHVSLLAEAGVPLHEIMNRVGQLDDETTKRVYLHVTRNRKKEACRLFAALMEEKKTENK